MLPLLSSGCFSWLMENRMKQDEDHYSGLGRVSGWQISRGIG